MQLCRAGEREGKEKEKGHEKCSKSKLVAKCDLGVRRVERARTEQRQRRAGPQAGTQEKRSAGKTQPNIPGNGASFSGALFLFVYLSEQWTSERREQDPRLFIHYFIHPFTHPPFFIPVRPLPSLPFPSLRLPFLTKHTQQLSAPRQLQPILSSPQPQLWPFLFPSSPTSLSPILIPFFPPSLSVLFV